MSLIGVSEMVDSESILNPNGRRLAAIMESRNVWRVYPELPIWEIKSTGVAQWLIEMIRRSPPISKSYEERRVAVLASLIRAGVRSFLICGGVSILTYDGVKQSGDGIWELSREVDVQALFDELSTEAWWLYGRAEPIRKGDDVCLKLMRRPEETVESMVKHDISYLIDAFHDNEPWRVALSPKNEMGC